MEQIQTSKSDFVRAEVADLDGRRIEDAKREGLVRWKMAIRAMERERNHRSWVFRGAQAKLEMRRARGVARKEKRTRAIRNLVLTPAPNQFIPSAAE